VSQVCGTRGALPIGWLAETVTRRAVPAELTGRVRKFRKLEN